MHLIKTILNLILDKDILPVIYTNLNPFTIVLSS
jgi:hypothetical protein